MKLIEALETIQAKQEYRELVKQYHTDRGGDHKTMTDINTAKDSGDEAIHKLFLKLKGVKSTKKAVDTTDKKTLTVWLDEIVKHYPGMMAFIETDANESLYARLVYRVAKETVFKFVMNAQNIKSQSELAIKIKDVLLGNK